MRRRDFLIGLALLPLAGCAGRNLANASKNTEQSCLRRLETLFPELMAESAVPGAAIALVQKGRLVWSRGFGVKNSESKIPVGDDALFEAASVSKTVFAYAALKLAEKGVIGLDTPLTKYTPTRFVEGDPRI